MYLCNVAYVCVSLFSLPLFPVLPFPQVFFNIIYGIHRNKYVVAGCYFFSLFSLSLLLVVVLFDAIVCANKIMSQQHQHFDYDRKIQANTHFYRRGLRGHFKDSWSSSSSSEQTKNTHNNGTVTVTSFDHTCMCHILTSEKIR